MGRHRKPLPPRRAARLLTTLAAAVLFYLGGPTDRRFAA